MKKILRIACYDFRRLVLNPITMAVVGVLLVAVLLFSTFYHIPTTPEYKAEIVGSTTQAVFENFEKNNYADAKSSLEKIFGQAQAHINIVDHQDHSRLDDINSKFLDILDKVKVYKYSGSSEYLTGSQGINEILENVKTFNEFVQQQKNIGEFETELVFTKKQFAELENINNTFQKIVNPGNLEDPTKQNFTRQERELILNQLYDNAKIFESLDRLVTQEIVTIVFVDEEKISQLQAKYITKSREKLDKVEAEMSKTSASATRGDTSYIPQMQALATTYKLICEGSKAGIDCELKLLLQSHFGNLNNLHAYSPINEEAAKIALAQFAYYLDSEQLAFEQYQQPLNFNIASYQETAFDSAYFVVSIIGFLTILFGMFCAYKLFGLDRRNGKMDLILSQDVRFGQVFAGKFLAIVFSTSAILALFAVVSLIWSLLFSTLLPNSILAVFNHNVVYLISPFLFFIIKLLGIELQVVFYSMLTIFLMNLTRKFEVSFGVAIVIFALATIFNIFFHTSLAYCLFPFIHADLTSFLGGGITGAGFLQTALYSHGNFFISLAYYVVVVGLLYNFTNQLFKKN